jgi:cytochrome c
MMKLLSAHRFHIPAAVLALSACFARHPQAQCADPKASDFKKETLADGATLNQPVELTVAKNGMVFVAQRGGEIMWYNPATNKTTQVGKVNTYLDPSTTYDVGGPLGIAVSTAFPQDNWVYIYYAYGPSFNGQKNKENGRLTYRLSRFRFVSNALDMPSEQVLLEVPSIWETHNSGSLKFGKNNDLWLSVGDNHDFNCSDQFSPMDERPGYSWCDDQGSTANTNDLRGKVLRIHPEETQQAGGKYYSIPAGNLKEKYASIWTSQADLDKVRPEIYTMGHRNPYRIFPDPITGRLYIGEFGPATGKVLDRGPTGADQIRITDEPANFGYPYFLKDNQPYCHWQYSGDQGINGQCVAIEGQAGLKYDPAKPVNTSPNNTGVKILPPAKPSSAWNNDNGAADPVAGLSGCGFGAGPVYHFDPSLDSKVKFPPALDKKWILFPIGGSGAFPQAKYITEPKQSFGLATGSENPVWASVINLKAYQQDMEFGPGDGALYAVDYGTNAYANNGDDGLYRISYTGCLPAVSVTPRTSGPNGRAHVALQGFGGSLVAPVGAVGADLYDLSGKKVWTASIEQGTTHIEAPASLGKGVFRVVWR